MEILSQLIGVILEYTHMLKQIFERDFHYLI